MPTTRPAITWSRERRLTHRGVLWLGLACDVRCKFCYDEMVSAREKMWMPAEEAMEALDKFRFVYRNEFVDLMGGEPTLHPQAIRIVTHAAEIGLRPTVITHGMHLADPGRARAYADAGIHDVLMSVHGIGDTVAAIHQRDRDNFASQVAALDNLRALGVPVRFNCTVIADNLNQLTTIAELASERGVRVVNFLTFNPYFEWSTEPDIDFQVRHSQAATALATAIDRCVELGIEANVRYLPLCQLPGREQHVYTGYQLPYDPHEWDYNSWYDSGYPGSPDTDWYLRASRRQQQRHHYVHVPACDGCALRAVCDGFHEQYVARWGGGEARPYPGEAVTDPRHFIQHQNKVEYVESDTAGPVEVTAGEMQAATHLPIGDDGRAGVRRPRPTGR